MASQLRSAGTITGGGTGSYPWYGLSYIQATSGDDVYASVYFPAGTVAETASVASCTNCGFSIPDGATINGIKWHTRGYASFLTNDYGAVMYPTLRKADNTIFSQDNIIFPESAGAMTLGSATDLWGTTWTPADINASGFGFRLYVYGYAGDSSYGDLYAYVDYVALEVFYTEPLNDKMLLMF